MEWFIDDLDDADFADRLARAIAGRGAFRRFKDRLLERPGLLTRWHASPETANAGGPTEGRALAWHKSWSSQRTAGRGPAGPVAILGRGR